MQLTEEIAECYRHASHCRERARRAIDPETERDFLEVERRWLSLARSYEFAERLAAPVSSRKQQSLSNPDPVAVS